MGAVQTSGSVTDTVRGGNHAYRGNLTLANSQGTVKITIRAGSYKINGGTGVYKGPRASEGSRSALAAMVSSPAWPLMPTCKGEGETHARDSTCAEPRPEPSASRKWSWRAIVPDIDIRKRKITS